MSLLCADCPTMFGMYDFQILELIKEFAYHGIDVKKCMHINYYHIAANKNMRRVCSIEEPIQLAGAGFIVNTLLYIFIHLKILHFFKRFFPLRTNHIGS